MVANAESCPLEDFDWYLDVLTTVQANAPPIINFIGGNAKDAEPFTKIEPWMPRTGAGVLHSSNAREAAPENDAYQIPSFDFGTTATTIDLIKVIELGSHRQLIPELPTKRLGSGWSAQDS